MYARILKFLTNLLFKRVFKGFLTPRKKRKPIRQWPCSICGQGFLIFNKRQKICKNVACRKIHRALQYRAGLERKRLEANKATVESAMRRDPSDLESEE
ncbi:hypothetical protein LCGC14_2774030 [marine sediment metagenome]|uniref:Uncharacterized protein n=1 Tax=marine sediment metagenome TaxID=412755 RepID=A0A0F8ZH91_9ZZZZ